MIKHAFIVFTTTIIFSTTCMEQDKSAYTLHIQTTSPNSIVIYPAETYKQEECIKVNEPSWILSSPDDELIPLYKPTSSVPYANRIKATIQSICHREQPLLHKNTFTQNKNSYLEERLYNSACDFIDHLKTASTNHSDIVPHKQMIIIIELMNTAKKKGITEDFMAECAYQKYLSNGLNSYIPFVFGCLKKYMLTIQDLKEQLPFRANNFYNNNNLTQTLNVACKENISEEQIKENLPSYPAYDNLVQNIKKIFGLDLTDYISHLYSSIKTASPDYPKYDHLTNSHEYYGALISHLSPTKPCFINIYNSFNLIEHVKKSNNIKQEKDLGKNILILERQPTFKEKMLSHPTKEYPILNKNTCAMFCILVEKYNKARNKKITPNSIQSGIYRLRQNYGLALPDFFDTNLLDKNYYALEEFDQLTSDTQILRSTNRSDLQDLIDQYYIFNEKEQS